MNKNVLLILAVIVTLLAAWLVISLASATPSIGGGSSTNDRALRTAPEPIKEVTMSVTVEGSALSTSVNVAE